MNKFLHSYIHLKAAKILQKHDEFNGYYLHCRTVSLLLWNWYCIAYDMNPKLLSMAVLLHFDFIILSPLLRDMYELWDKKEKKRKRRKHFVENVNQTNNFFLIHIGGEELSNSKCESEKNYLSDSHESNCYQLIHENLHEPLHIMTHEHMDCPPCILLANTAIT